MATGQISQRFQIVITGPTDLNVAKTFSVARPLTVTGATVFNIAAATGTLTLTGATAGIFTADTDAPPIAGAAVIGTNAGATSGGPTQSAAIFAANSQLLAGEVVTVLTSAATITTVWLNCIANPATAITVT
jgi:hypothetical protein